MKPITQNEIADILKCGANRVSQIKKQKDGKTFHFVQLGILVHKKGISLDQLEFEIYKRDVEKTDIKVREMLEFTRADQLTKKSLTGTGPSNGYKFRMKYYSIFGALTELAGITIENMKEFADERKTETYEIGTDLPSLKDWKTS